MARKKKDDIDRKRFTTLLPDEIAKKIRLVAVERGQLYYEVVEAALKEYLYKKKNIKNK